MERKEKRNIEIVRLYDEEDKTFGEIADETDLSKARVHKIYHETKGKKDRYVKRIVMFRDERNTNFKDIAKVMGLEVEQVKALYYSGDEIYYK